jgi:hypothetical protein
MVATKHDVERIQQAVQAGNDNWYTATKEQMADDINIQVDK